MRRSRCSALRSLAIFLGFLSCFTAGAEDPSPSAVSAFNTYINLLELRLAQQRRSPSGFLVAVDSNFQQTDLQRGELRVEELTPPAGPPLPGALLHHWRGTAFVPGVSAAEFQRFTSDVNAYPSYYAPEVLEAKALVQRGDYLETWMRVRQHHVLTVVLDMTYDTTYGRYDPQHGYSLSRSTRISEIDSPGSPAEHPLSAREQHGFLWRLNTYWSYEERDGGLYLQIESVSLTRSIPRGLGWIIGPFLETIPRESLTFTLRSTGNALQKLSAKQTSRDGEAGGSKEAQ